MKMNLAGFSVAIALLAGIRSLPAAILPTPTVSSSATPYSASFVAGNFFDSVVTTEYASQTKGAGPAFSTTAGTWMQFDFGAPVALDRMLLMNRDNTADLIGSYRLILSNDAVFDATDSVFTMTGLNTGRLAASVKSFTQTTARYARWEVATSTGTSQNLGGAEMRFLNTPTGSAIITPVTAYASATEFSASYARGNAVNGDAGRGGGLEYACASLGAGMYVDFDMGSVVQVNGFDFFDRIPAVDRTTAFNLIFDDDSPTFASPVTALSFSPGSAVWGYSQTFAAINARYVRLDATATTGAANNSGIQEIIFYRDSNVNAPLVANANATSITPTGATVGGNITRVGVDTPTVTLYYGTTNGGTNPVNWQASVNLGPQTAAFSTSLTGLLPYTRYYFTSFAQNSAGGNWAGTPLEFATPVGVPSVANVAASELTTVTARVGGTVTNTGGKAPVLTLYYGPADGGTNPAAWQHQVSLGGVTTTATTVLGGLSPNTPYFFRVYGANEAGTAWAPATATFTTPAAALPAVQNLPPTQINAFSANLNGRLTSTGNAPTTATIFYGPADGGTNPAAWAFSADGGLQSGDFSLLVTNLSASTPFFFRVRAQNSAGTAWAADSATFTTTGFAPATVYLNEFVAATDNDDPHPYCDSDGTPQDWIELHNPAASAIDIGEYYLTDNAARLNKWRFPAPTIIPANGFLVVFASNKDRAVSGQQLHTNFRLAAEGEFLALVQPDGSTIVRQWAPAYPVVPEYWSYGLKPPAADGAYAPFQIPTPGAANTTTAGAPAGDVVFSIPSQTFTTASISLTLSTASPTAQIRYTLDRTEPTASSPLYSAALSISTTTMVRARAFETVAGFAPGLVHSETYIRLGTTVTNGFSAATFNSNLPVVLLNNFGAGKPTADAQMHWTLFSPNAATANRTALTNAPVLATRGRMVVRGSSSAAWPKYSMNIEAWDEANEDTDVAPLGMAPEADWVLQSNYEFDRGMIRNPFMYEISNRAGRWAPHWRFVEVFANTNDGIVDYPADYMGVYAIMEKPERGADRIPVERLDKNDLSGDALTGGYIVKVDRVDPGTTGWSTSRNFPLTEPFGSEVRLNYGYPEELPSPAPAIPAQQSAYIRNYVQAFEDAVVQTNRTNPTTGLHYTEYIDRDSWVDHGLLNILAQNADCFRLSTYMHKPRGGKLIAGPIWDFDRTICSSDARSANPTGWSAIQPATDIMTWGWWKYLWPDPDFWQRFTDRWFELRDGVLTNANLTGLVTQFQADLSEAAVRNYQKWTAMPPRNFPNTATTGTFSTEMDIVRDWLTRRTAWVDSQFVPRPVRNPAGGQTASVTLTASQGTIYYTLDGIDPRLPGGAINPAAQTLASGASTPISGSAQLTVRAKTATLWSAPSTGYYFPGTPASAANTVISEIHYHPADPTLAEQVAGFTNADDFEFVEVHNISAGPVDLSGTRFTAGIDFTFPLGTILAAGQRIVVVSSFGAFAARYPDIPHTAIAGEYLNDRLENAGERLTLLAATGSVIKDFSYGTTDPWPASPDGTGPSLVLIQPEANPDHSVAANWRASVPGPNPNTDDAIHFTGSPNADSDSDGWTDLVEYALGPDPQITYAITPEGLTMTVPRVPNADDAEIFGEASTALSGWIAAELIGSTDTSLTFRVPDSLAAGSRVFIRSRVQLR